MDETEELIRLGEVLAVVVFALGRLPRVAALSTPAGLGPRQRLTFGWITLSNTSPSVVRPAAGL